MITCPNCGTENPERAKFCLECASPLSGASARQAGTRKLVTVLFADVVGSTALGERIDPETMRVLLARYFGEAKRVVERHGGTIEKFIGDAVMAVFGIPQLHEDDALRAVRAALELRAAINELNDEVAQERGIRIDFRIGVNSGQVVAGGGAGSTLVTGDAVNVAARLEQAATSDQILMGEATYKLVRDYVQAERTPPVAAKGKSEALVAYSLLGLRDADAGVPRTSTHFVGRRRELSRLTEAFEDATEERRCYLFTLLGSAGVGKSRLVAEFVRSVGDRATVVRGRCLPYGDGITFWPIAEICRSLAGAEESDDAQTLRARLMATVGDAPEGSRVIELVASAIGLSGDAAPRDELFWGVRRWLEMHAQEQPLLCLIEDIHWAEPTLLDLIENVADWTRDAPILLLCTARPELLEARPTWAGGKVNASTLLLEPLSADLTRELVSTLTDDRRLPPEVVARVLDRAEGNPLFAEEITRMLLDGESVSESVSIPTSVQAVIAARLDRLPAHERSVAGRASVVGRVFERGAVLALVPEEERALVPQSLLSLVRKELVHPDRAELTVDEAFRFRHLLIRDTAYEALPKEERAELHERFANWVEQIAGDRSMEYDEIVGYHYEQAHRYRRELGLADENTAQLARLAGQRLSAAGQRALNRGDSPAATKLLTRAVSVLQPGPEQRAALVHLIYSHFDARAWVTARPIAEELLREAVAADDLATAMMARLLLHSIGLWSDPTARTDEGEQLFREAVPLFDRLGHKQGLAVAYVIKYDVHLSRAEWAQALEAAEKGASYAAGAAPFLEASLRSSRTNAALWGPTPVQQLLHIVDEELSATHAERTRAALLGVRALARAIAGLGEEARADIQEAVRLNRSIYGPEQSSVFVEGAVEYLLGDLAAAQSALERMDEELERVSETGARSTILATKAVVLWERGRPSDEVIDVAQRALSITAEDDAASMAFARQALALARARNGEFDEAERLIERARDIAGRTDFLWLRGTVFRDEARIAELAGKRDKALERYRAALSEFEQKGDVMDAARMREAIARLA